LRAGKSRRVFSAACVEPLLAASVLAARKRGKPKEAFGIGFLGASRLILFTAPAGRLWID
jgi:hypothetical protein